MKALTIHIILIINVLSLVAQNNTRILEIRDSEGNPLIGVTGMYYDKDNMEIISTLSDLEGRIFLRNDYFMLSLKLIGFKDTVINNIVLDLDTNKVILKSIRYHSPRLLIDKSTLKYHIDYSEFIDKITVRRIEYDENCPTDTVFFEDGTYDFEICDTLKFDYDCKTAFIQYDEKYEKFYKWIVDKLESVIFNYPTIDDISVDFNIDRKGQMNIESLSGLPEEYLEKFSYYLKSFKWKPADLYGKSITTKYKMMIILD